MEDPLLDLAPIPVGTFDADGALGRSNQALRSLLGIGAASVACTPADLGPDWVALVAACRAAVTSARPRASVTCAHRRYEATVWTLGSSADSPIAFALAPEHG